MSKLYESCFLIVWLSKYPTSLLNLEKKVVVLDSYDFMDNVAKKGETPFDNCCK